MDPEPYPLCDSYAFSSSDVFLTASRVAFYVLVVRIIVTPCILLEIKWFLRVVSFSYL